MILAIYHGNLTVRNHIAVRGDEVSTTSLPRCATDLVPYRDVILTSFPRYRDVVLTHSLATAWWY